MFKRLLLSLVLLSGMAFGQSIVRYGDDAPVLDSGGHPISNAEIFICTNGTTCSSGANQVQLYSDTSGDTITQPVVTDANGNWHIYVAPGTYEREMISRGVTTVTPDYTIGGGGGGGGSTNPGGPPNSVQVNANNTFGGYSAFQYSSNLLTVPAIQTTALSTIPLLQTTRVTTPNGTVLGGVINLGNTELLSWVNGAGTGTDTLGVSGSNVLEYNGVAVGQLLDPGANGILKRTAFGVTAVTAASDIVPLWNGCTASPSTVALYADGNCRTPSGSGNVSTQGLSGSPSIPNFVASGSSTTIQGSPMSFDTSNGQFRYVYVGQAGLEGYALVLGANDDQPLGVEVAHNSGFSAGAMVKLTSSGWTLATTSDTTVPVFPVWATSIGITGNDVVAVQGVAWCVSDNGSFSPGDYIIESTTTAHRCHDAGSTQPTGVYILGQAVDSEAVQLMPMIPGSGSGGDFSSPPPIGNVSPNTGAFTTLNVTVEAKVPNPSGSSDAVNLGTMLQNGSIGSCGTAGAISAYLSTGNQLSCDTNIVDANGTVTIIEPLLATSLGTSGTGSGELDFQCGAAQTFSGAGFAGIAAPSSCSSGALFVLPSAIGSDGQVLYQVSHSGTTAILGFTSASGGGSPGGSNNSLQWNDSGSFAGTTSMSWNDSTTTLTLGGSSAGTFNVWQINSNQPNIASGYACFGCLARGDAFAWRDWANNGNDIMALCGSSDRLCWASPSLNGGSATAFAFLSDLAFTNLSGTASQGQLPANTVFNNQGNTFNTGDQNLASATSFELPNINGDPSSYVTGTTYYNTAIGAATYATSSSTLQRVAHQGLLQDFNLWANNYLLNQLASADAAGTVHSVGVVVGESTVAGTNATGTGAFSSWVEEISTNGATPKLAELLQFRFGRANNHSGYGGDGWSSISSGNAQTAGMSLNTSGASNLTVYDHNGTTALCPDGHVGIDNTVNDVVTWTASNTTNLTFYALEQPNGGSFAISIDGGSYGGNVSTAGASYAVDLASASSGSLSEGSHTISVKVTVLGTGSVGVAFCGVRSQDTTRNQTFEVEKWGATGSELNKTFNSVPSQVLTDLSIDPAFVAVEAGTYERFNNDRTLAQIQSDLHSAKSKINSVWPNASVIYVAPPNVSNASCSGGTCNYTMAQVYKAIKDQANADAVGFLDFYDITNSSTQIADWSPCPWANGSAPSCAGINLTNSGAAWLATEAYPFFASIGVSTRGTMVDSLPSTAENSAYSYTAEDFSGLHSGPAWYYASGSNSPTYTLPSTAPTAGACVMASNIGTGTLTIAPNGVAVDGSTSSFTLAQYDWVKICSDGSAYKSIGLDSRNSSGGSGINFQGSVTANAIATDYDSSHVQALSTSPTIDATTGRVKLVMDGTHAGEIDFPVGSCSGASGSNVAICAPTSLSTAYNLILPGNSVSSGLAMISVSSNTYTMSVGALTGDVTTLGSAATLATVNSSPGSCGDSTHICEITTNGKGLVTSQSVVSISGGSTAYTVDNFGLTTATSWSNGTTYYFSGMNGGLLTSNTVGTVEPFCTSVKGLSVGLSANVGSGNTFAFTVYDSTATSTTTSTCSISAGNSSCTDTSHTPTWTSGDLMSVQASCSGTCGPGQPQVTARVYCR